MKKLFVITLLMVSIGQLIATDQDQDAKKAVPVDAALADLPTAAEGDFRIFRGRAEDRCLNHALWARLKVTSVLKNATWPANPLVFPATPREGSDPKLQFFQELDTTREPLLSDARAKEQCGHISLKRLENELLWMIRRNQENSWPYCWEARFIRDRAMWEVIEYIRKEREKKADEQRRSKKIDTITDAAPVVTTSPAINGKSEVMRAYPAEQTKAMMPDGARVAAGMPGAARNTAQ